MARMHNKAAPERRRQRIERQKQVAREIYEEQGQRPEIAAIRSGPKIPRRSTRQRTQQPPRGSGLPNYSSDDMEMLYD